MFKFLSIKDPHFQYGFMSKIRKDYERDKDNKLEFINNFCKENEIYDIIFTGDVLDKSSKKWSFKQYGLNKRKLNKLRTTDSKRIKLYSNVGNHDMENGLENPDVTDHIVTTVFEELVYDEVLNNITREPLINNDVMIYGINFSADKNIILNELERINNINSNDKCKIVIMHSNVTPDEERLTDFLYKDLAERFEDIDIFINGHYHIGFDTKLIQRPRGKKAYFVNNWNLCRVMRDYDVTLNKHNVNMEYIQIGDIEEIGNIKQRKIIIQSIDIPHLTYEEAFNIKNINLLKKTKDEVFEFFENNKIQELASFKDSDETLLQRINRNRKDSGQKEITQKVLDRIKDYLEL